MYRAFHNLRVRFAQLDLTQNQAARLAGLAPSTLTTRMTGRVPFNAWEIAALAKVLEIKPEEYGMYFFDALPGQKKGA